VDVPEWAVNGAVLGVSAPRSSQTPTNGFPEAAHAVIGKLSCAADAHRGAGTFERKYIEWYISNGIGSKTLVTEM
jgi:hypothetical protein